jgi:tetratricopeptide (TPR) repeat protein
VDTCQLVADWLNEGDEVNGDDDGNDGDRKADRAKSWLVIVDNVDSLQALDQPLHVESNQGAMNQAMATNKTLRHYLPRRLGDEHVFLITTRSQEVASSLGDDGSWIHIGPFNPDESQVLITSKLKAQSHEGVSSTMHRLLDKLGRIPLAITQAAAFMKRNRVSESHFLSMLEKGDQHLADHLSTELQDPRRPQRWPNSIFRTWKISFDEIRTQDPLAAELLSMMAMLDGQQIPKWFLSSAGTTEAQIAMSIGTLFSYSLISHQVQSDMVSVHPLVQASLRYWLREEGRHEAEAQKVLSLMADVFPNGEYENWEKCKVLMPHAEMVLEYHDGKQMDQDQRGRLLNHMAWYEYRCGMYPEAFRHAEAAYQGLRSTLGETAFATLKSLNIMGSGLQRQGKYKEAEEMCRRVLAGSQKILGEEHPETLQSIDNLALVLVDQGKYEKAEEMHRRVLAGSQKILGEEHPYTLRSINNLAAVLAHLGNYEEAEETYRQALVGRKRTLGEEHPNTLTSTYSLASVLVCQGKNEKAEEMYRQALGGRKRMLGEEHPDTLTSVYSLAWLYHTQGNTKGAAPLYHGAVTGFRRALGPDHPTTLACERSLASMLHSSSG